MCNVEGPPLKKLRAQLLHPTEPLPIYLDTNATTPVCHEAWEAMEGCRTHWGNASSIHPYGLDAKFVMADARERCAKALGVVRAENIIFTSGGTEANNLAIIGGARAASEISRNMVDCIPNNSGCSRRQAVLRDVIVATNTEHPAVEEVLKAMESVFRDTFITVRVPVSKETGVLSPECLERFLSTTLVSEYHVSPDRVALVTIMHANNELGSVHPIAELVKATKKVCGDGALFHTDAAQSIGKVPVHVEAMGVDYLSVCSHKFYGPKGVGALCVGSTAPMPKKITFGAGHESNLRPGTENIILNCGMVAALERACTDQPLVAAHMRLCRDTLHRVLDEELRKKHGMFFVVNGSLEHALPNTLNIAIGYEPTKMFISAQRLILEVGHIVAMSAGSACHSSLKEGEEIAISAPLRAVGVGEARAVGTLRLTCGRFSTEEEMRRAGRFIARRAIQQLADA